MSFTVTIAGNPVSIANNSPAHNDKIDEQSDLSFVVIDKLGTAFYTKNQPVVFTDATLGIIFSGYINNQPSATSRYPQAGANWSIQCRDQTWLTNKRTTKKTYKNQFAGMILVDMIQRWGSVEGLICKAALRWDELLTEWQAGTLSGTVATTNASDGNDGGGDLELALAGTPVNIAENSATSFVSGTFSGCAFSSGALAPVPTNAIKIVGTQSVPGITNSYTYWKIWGAGGAPTISNYYFAYDIWIDPSSAEAKIGVDMVFTDGTTMRDTPNINDAQNLACHPSIDLKGLASGRWYHRQFALGTLNGKTISYVTVAIEGNNSGSYTGWVKNINLLTGNNGSVAFTFFSGTLSTAQQMQTNGFSSSGVTVVPTYALQPYNAQLVGPSATNSIAQFNPEIDYPSLYGPNWYKSYSVDAAKILQSSFLSWDSNDPENTQTVISYYLDGWGAIQASNNAALPNLPAGLNLAGRTLSLCAQFFALDGASPEQAPALTALSCMINPSYNATKTDIAATFVKNSDWGSGTFSNTTASWFLDNPNPYSFRAWGTGSSLAGQDLFSASGAAAQAATSNGLQLTTGANSDVRVRMTDKGQFMNGVVSAFVNANTLTAGGVVYRCSNWGPNNDSYAYSVTMTNTLLTIGRGSNSTGAGVFTQIGTVTLALTSGTFHFLAVHYNGSFHQVYLDAVLVATFVDATYVLPGYTGLRCYNSQTTTQSCTFQDFSVWSGNALMLNGAIRNWDDGSNAGQSGWTTNGQYGQNNQDFSISVPANGEMRARMDWAGYFADFIMEFDVLLDTASVRPGCVYRTTGWQNGDNAYGYAVEITTTVMTLMRGSNSSTGTGTNATVATSATYALSSGNWHHIKVVVAGSSHKIYLDDVLMINATDSTYTSAGFVGLRNRNSSGSAYNAQFDNFGVVSALSGTWTSAPISLGVAGTYGNSVVSWRDQSSNPSVCANTIQTSINGGTTWTTCTNGGAIPGLTAGQSLTGINLQIKVTLSTTTASSLPGIDNLNVQLLGGFSASGSRISPALSLSNVNEANAALVSWNGIQPTGTTILVDTSLNGTSWVNVGSGASGSAPIGQITTRQNTIIDTFNVNSSAFYTSTHASGGSNSTWTWDTANSRISTSNGSHGFLLRNSITTSDIDIVADMDESDNGGVVWRYSDTGSGTNAYQLLLGDSTHGGTIGFYRYVSGTRTFIGGVPVDFPNGRPRRIRVTMIGAVITLYCNGVQVYAYTDSSPLAIGQFGLSNDFTGDPVRFYLFRVQPMGQNASALSLYTRVRLTSTDPTVTPQVLDLQAFVSSPDIDPGVVVDSASYVRTYLSDNIADLNTKSATTWWYVRADKSVVFRQRTATPAPWILDSSNSTALGQKQQGDLLIANLNLTTNGDVYRNRQVLTGVQAIATFVQSFTGDGSTQTWNLANPVVSTPVITLNGQSQSVGVKNIDTGRKFYYQIGSSTIDQDASGAILNKDVDILLVSYTGSFVTDLVRDNATAGTFAGTVSQAEMAAIDGTSGIVENVLDVSSLNLDIAAAQAYGDQLLQRNGSLGARTLTFQTLRSGLAPGQELSVFVPEQQCTDAQMLITQVSVSASIAPPVPGGVLYWYTVTATEGQNMGSPWKMLSSLLN